MNAALDPLSHTLGRIENALDTITKTLSEDRAAAAVYRTDMRRDLVSVKESVTDLKNRVNNTADDLAGVLPDIEDYRLKRAQGSTLWNAAKTLWVISIALGATGIGAIIHAFWPPK